MNRLVLINYTANLNLMESAIMIKYLKAMVLTLLSLSALPAFADDEAMMPEKNSTEKTVQTVCAACHGADGNSAIALNPKLAGQLPEYLLKQLTNFKEGKRANAVMAGIVANLTPDDMKNLANYYSAQKITLAKAKSNGSGSLGEKIYRGGIAASGVPACASCHGANGAGIPKQFPRLASQHADYTLTQMKAFRTGERANAPMMMTISAKMTDAEMQAVSDYMQGLR
jgi:cytochrome c553